MKLRLQCWVTLPLRVFEHFFVPLLCVCGAGRSLADFIIRALTEYSLKTSGVLDLRHSARGGNGSKMAALKEEQCYGLSCGRVSNGSNVSVFHVKLTDSALRAFEGYQSGKVNGYFRYSDILVSLWSLSGRLWQAEFGQSPLTPSPPPPPPLVVVVLVLLLLLLLVFTAIHGQYAAQLFLVCLV